MLLRSQILKPAPRCDSKTLNKRATPCSAFRRTKVLTNRISESPPVTFQLSSTVQHAQGDCGLGDTGRSSRKAGSRGAPSVDRHQGSEFNESWRFTGLCEEQLEEGLRGLVDREKQSRLSDVQVFKCLLQACGKKELLLESKVVHARIIERGLESDVSLGQSLVCTLVKCGVLVDALQVFRRLPCRTVSSWNAIISGHNKTGLPREALNMYHQMKEDGVHPNMYTFLTVLKSCSTLQDVEEGKRIHVHISEQTYGFEVVVANSLIHMYANCGSVLDARHVFNTMPERTVVSWNSMIAGYAEHEQGASAWQLYIRMQESGVRPDARTFVSILKACSSLALSEASILVERNPVKVKALKKCQEVYLEITARGELDVFVGSSLMKIFAVCGSIDDSRHVFNAMSAHNSVSWNAMIAGYVNNEQCEEALQLYSQMKERGLKQTDRTFVFVLKACASLAVKEAGSLVNGHVIKVRALRMGEAIHKEIIQSSHGSELSVGSHLVFMYACCGSIMNAEQVFNAMAEHDVLSWNALLSAHTELKQNEEALHLYCRMQVEGTRPDSRTFASLLKACGDKAASEPRTVFEGQVVKLESLLKGKELHDAVLCCGFESDNFVGNALICMYASCGSMTDAQYVFDMLPNRDVVSWNSLLAGYADEGQGDIVMQLYKDMKQTGAAPDARTFVSVLKGCSGLAAREASSLVYGDYVKVQSLQLVKNVHDEVVAQGHGLNSFIGNSVINLYAECGSIVDARQVFDTLSQSDVVSWNAMISGYAEHDQGEEAWKLYCRMKEQRISPNARTLVSVLKGLSSLAAQEITIEVERHSPDADLLLKVKTVHADALGCGNAADVFVASGLVKIYASCGSMHDAENVFDSLSHGHVVMWNAMISGYAQRYHSEKALQLYSQMQERSIRPDAWTFVSVLKAYGDLAMSKSGTVVDGPAIKSKSLQKGMALYADVVEHGYSSDIFVGNSLINMFTSLGSTEEARRVFDSLTKYDVMTWNAMISGYVHHDQGAEALQTYAQMLVAGVRPVETTFLCVLGACSTAGGLDACQQIHHDVARYRFSSSITVATALIHAYAKCGNMTSAQNVFDSMPELGVVGWNALITGYARQGLYERSLECFRDMQLAGVTPDAVTYLSLISACSHAGLVEQGLGFFHSMGRQHGLRAELQHYESMVDLLARAGLFKEVHGLLSHMPMAPSLSLWLSVLAACRKYNNIELGRRAFNQAVLLDPTQSAAYLLMSSIYSQASMWDSAKEMDQLRQNTGAQTRPGRSWIEYRQKVHDFRAGNRRQLDGTVTYLYDTLAELSAQLTRRQPDPGLLCDSNRVPD